MNYTLRQLQIFVEVVRLENVSRAAEALHMTQPAVSIQLRNFQQQFDIPLTEVVGKKLFVTDYGRSIAEVAQNLLNEAEAINYRTKAYQGLLTGKLAISAVSTGKYIMPYFLSRFLAQYPGIDLVLDVTNKQQVLNSLNKNEIDFALFAVLPLGIDIHEEQLLENRLYLVGNTPHYNDDTPLIFREAGSATRDLMNRHFNEVQGHKQIELTSNEAVKQALIAGIGCSVIPLIGIKLELLSGDLQIIPSPGLPIVTNWRLVWLKEKKLSPVAAAFLQHVREEKEAIVSQHFGWYLNYWVD